MALDRIVPASTMVLAVIVFESVAAPPTTRPATTRPAAETGRAVRAAAQAVIDSLTPAQRELADQPYQPAAIRAISLFPGVRAGVRFGDLNATQREHVGDLLGLLFTPEGLRRAKQVFSQGDGAGDYYFARFCSEPVAGPLVWRVEGHHFSVTLFVDQKNIVRPGTLLIGGNPGDVWEDLAVAARVLYASLDPDRRKAITAVTSPRRAGNQPFGDPLPKAGLAFTELTSEQQAAVRKLLTTWRALFEPAALAPAEAHFFEREGKESLRIAFSGDPASANGEFYCGLTGGGAHLEFDNRQGHVHMLLHFTRGTLHDWNGPSTTE